MNKEYANQLWEAYSTHPTRELRNELAVAYLPLAAKIAARFQGRGLDYDDLLQTASLALLKAIEGFKADRGIRFTTYAVPTIMGTIRNEIRDRSGVIRLPESQMEKKRMILQKRRELEEQFSRTPTPQEIAERLHMDAADVLLLTTIQFVSLDAPLSEDGSGYEEILGENDPSFARLEDRQWMESMNQWLHEQEKVLIDYRFHQNLSQRETAKQMGISQMQVSRMERRLLEKLRRIETSVSSMNQ